MEKKKIILYNKVIIIILLFCLIISLKIPLLTDLFPLSLVLFFISIYLFGIFSKDSSTNISDWKMVYEKWNDGIRYVIYSFIIILILMSIGRIGTVLIYESFNAIESPNSQIIEKFSIKNDSSNITLYKDISDNLKNEQYYANYEGIIGDNFTAKLITLDEILFMQKIYGSIPEILLKERNYENIPEDRYIVNNMAANYQIAPIDIQSNKSVIISRTFTSEPKQNYAGLFGNISLSFIRSEIARILFLIILINIFSLVKCLIEEEDLEGTKKKLNKFANLLLSTLVLGLILTLLPQGDVGDVILSIDLQTGISAFLIIISFIIISFFKLRYLKENSPDTQNMESKPLEL